MNNYDGSTTTNDASFGTDICRYTRQKIANEKAKEEKENEERFERINETGGNK